MKRFAIFGGLWPLLLLVFLVLLSDSALPAGNSFAANLKWIYVWAIVPALLLGALDLLVAKFRYGFAGVAVFAGAVGFALTYSVAGALATAIPTLVCGALTGLADGRWTLRKESGNNSAPASNESHP